MKAYKALVVLIPALTYGMESPPEEKATKPLRSGCLVQSAPAALENHSVNGTGRRVRFHMDPTELPSPTLKKRAQSYQRILDQELEAINRKAGIPEEINYKLRGDFISLEKATPYYAFYTIRGRTENEIAEPNIITSYALRKDPNSAPEKDRSLIRQAFDNIGATPNLRGLSDYIMEVIQNAPETHAYNTLKIITKYQDIAFGLYQKPKLDSRDWQMQQRLTRYLRNLLKNFDLIFTNDGIYYDQILLNPFLNDAITNPKSRLKVNLSPP